MVPRGGLTQFNLFNNLAYSGTQNFPVGSLGFLARLSHRLSSARILPYPSDMKANKSPMAYRSNNLVPGRQLRAARTLAGMTQRDLATALAVNERAVRFWERKHDRHPTSAPNDARIEQALLERGVILFAEPTPVRGSPKSGILPP